MVNPLNAPLPEYLQFFLNNTLQYTKFLFDSCEEQDENAIKTETAKRLRYALRALEGSLAAINPLQSADKNTVEFISNQGLLVELQLAQMLRIQNLEEQAQDIDQKAYQCILQMNQNKLSIHVFQPVVNVVSYRANHTQDNEKLINIFNEVSPLIQVLSPIEDKTSAKYNVHKLLIFNYAIIGTRTLDPTLMTKGLNTLVKHLPDERKTFIEQGMAQMDIIGYPQPIRDVMETFYLQYATSKVLH